MKKITALLMALLMIFSLSTVTFAAQVPDQTVQPQWDYMATITLLLNFIEDENLGQADVSVNPYINYTTRLEGTVTIYKMVGIDWVYVDSKTESAEELSLGFYLQFPATSGVMYKAVLDVTAYGPGGSETDSVKKIRTCP